MGRQINFYITKETIDVLAKHILNSGYYLLNQHGDILDYKGLDNYSCIYLYKPSYGDLVYRHDINRLSIIDSPIIEVTFGGVLFNKKKILRGRFWVEGFIYTEKGKELKSEELISDYKSLVKLVKKHISMANVKCGEHYVKEYADEEAIRLQNEEGFILW